MVSPFAPSTWVPRPISLIREKSPVGDEADVMLSSRELNVESHLNDSNDIGQIPEIPADVIQHLNEGQDSMQFCPSELPLLEEPTSNPISQPILEEPIFNGPQTISEAPNTLPGSQKRRSLSRHFKETPILSNKRRR